MNRFFNMDNKFFVFMGRVADLILLNILCILCCIPIVTAGASITALYYVTLKMARDEESYIIRSFFCSFKQNFKQSTLIWILMLAAGVLIHMEKSALAVITILPMTMTLVDAKLFPVYLLIWLMFGFSLTAYANSWFMWKLFKPYFKEDEEEHHYVDTEPDQYAF